MENTTIENLFLYVILLILVVVIFILLFNSRILNNLLPGSTNNGSKSEQGITADIIFLMSVISLFIISSIALIPQLKNIRDLLYQISNVSYIVIYTIFLILLFNTNPKNIVDNYSYIITPSTLLLTVYFFIKAYTKDYIYYNNINNERIKSIILFICLITILALYYFTNPGGNFTKIFGSSFYIVSLLVTVFAFLYAIILLTLSDETKEGNIDKRSYMFLSSIPQSFIERLPNIMSPMLFVLFIVITIIGMGVYPGGFWNNKAISTSVLILLVTTIVLWSVSLISRLFPAVSNNQNANEKMKSYKSTIMWLFGITSVVIIIATIASNIQKLTGETGVNLLLNLILILSVVSLIYKTIEAQFPVGNANKNGFFELLYRILIFIPCIFTDLLNVFMKISISEPDNATKPSLIIIATITLIVLFYIGYNKLFKKINLQGGNQIINEPIRTNTLQTLAGYNELNGTDNFNYQYGISFWVFIDSASPNTGPAYVKYSSLLNYGGKPNVLYNANKHTLIITMGTENKSIPQINNQENNNNEDYELDRIIYKNENMLLQKWNNFVINYSGGTLDIFLNGELVKSIIEVVPYMSLDTLTVGENAGINSSICNVVYFKTPLNKTNMYYLYNMIKDKSPPIAK